MVTTTINGVRYEVRVPFDMLRTMANVAPTYRRQEPSVRRCDCCDRCTHVERYYEEHRSIEDVIAAGWLVATGDCP